MEKLRVLLLHGDPGVRAELRLALLPATFAKVLGEAENAYEAMELLEHVPYGALFAGVELPGGVSGLELGQMLSARKHRPAMIFVAPNQDYAYPAIELEALDYLVWPAPEERLAKTLDRLRQVRASADEARPLEPAPRARMSPGSGGTDQALLQLPLDEDDEDQFLSALRSAWQDAGSGPHGGHGGARRPEIERLAVSLDGRTVLVAYDQVVFVEAYADYSYVHTTSNKFLTSYRLKNLQERLAPHGFFRVHRKYLVNLNMVTEIASLPGSNFMLRTAGKTRIELPVSRRRIAELKQILGF